MTLCMCNTVDIHGVGKFINQLHPDQVLDTVGLPSATKDVQRHLIIYGQNLYFLKYVTV